MRFIFLFLLCLGLQSFVLAQTSQISGNIFDVLTNEPLPFAIVNVTGAANVTATADENGKFVIDKIPSGLYNIDVRYIGYKNKTIFEVEVTLAKQAILEIGLEAEGKELEVVEVKGPAFTKSEESPLSLRTIGVNEIERSPGGGRDISKVVQSLPGVASTPSFRNDIIIRGGSPSENRFYIDGFEVPNINHFATQGASGGPVGMLNVNLINSVDVFSGAFQAQRGNALSSVFEFKMKNGRTDKRYNQFVIGSSDLAFSTEGPLGKKKSTSYILSYRRSYLQYLFKALKLPFLPTYNDFYLKTKTKLTDKSELVFFGLGAIDVFKLNVMPNPTDEQIYQLGYLPESSQWNYTFGVSLKQFKSKGFGLWVLSRNMLNNESKKYENNIETNPLLLKYRSQEIENKFRYENYSKEKGYGITYGVGAEYAKYNNSTYNKVALPSGQVQVLDYNSAIDLVKFNSFVQVSKAYLKERLTLSLGARIDGNTYTQNMSNPFKQLSPRFSASYALNSAFNLNFNVGQYFQLPTYTVLGYRNSNGDLVNQTEDLKYIRCNHIVAGIEFNTKSNSRITFESFYKLYDHYPLSTVTGLSLANQGSDFGVIGNEQVASISKGRAYGAEVMLQQKLFKGFYGILSYTLVRSEFTNSSGDYNPSAWDYNQFAAITLGKKIARNWEFGTRYRISGGAPTTPYDVPTSALIPVWDVSGKGQLDYNQPNSQRLGVFNQLDIRVDKRYYFNKWSLNFYIDIQNVLNFKYKLKPNLDVVRDANGNPVIDPNDSSRYQMRYVENTSGTILPTIGVIVDF